MKQYPQCIYCKDIYGTYLDHPRIPKVLKCGDTICKECLGVILNSSRKKYFVCPVCNQQLKKEKSIDDYITNKEFIKILNSCFGSTRSVNEKAKFEFNVITLGDYGVGKSSLFKRLLKNKFPLNQLSTVGYDYNEYYVKYHGEIYKLLCYDTGGQDKYRCIVKSLVRKADGALFVYDITDKTSFESLDYWYNLYKEIHENVVGLIIGNKCDLNDERVVDKEEAENFAKDHELNFVESSALLDKMVIKSIAILLDEIIKSKGLKNDYVSDSVSDRSRKKSITSIKSLTIGPVRRSSKKKKCDC